MPFLIWEDGHRREAFTVDAPGIETALDVAASRLGFCDYAELAEARGWGEDDGLNIVDSARQGELDYYGVSLA